VLGSGFVSLIEKGACADLFFFPISYCCCKSSKLCLFKKFREREREKERKKKLKKERKEK
jgi:hypothetical protein